MQEKDEENLTKAVRKYMAKIGSRGGQTKGKTKRRGGSEYYRTMRLKAIRKKKDAAKKAADKSRTKRRKSAEEAWQIIPAPT